ncbi:hypothetical protein FY557_19470 [Chryseobacterium sp. SN22]|uniref:hypothetical protein n=1 Tax=Chryseobacterium sp. SN22 TaxID=2606431 RepID=UPI0011EC4BE2|nr:hypothetical protein [Chryseobacterium sp. SN22]KAA0126031.1 hypothetical protein FY557_19470 [Chryseobacterium sp. SN22]
MVFFLFSCQNKGGNNDYIEIAKGFDMDPKEPRIGIILSSKDSLYFCREIIKGRKGIGEYEYFQSNDTIHFDRFKKKILKEFKEIDNHSGIPDAQPTQLKYRLENNNYDQIFYIHNLSPKQQKTLKGIFDLQKSKKLKKINYYKFSSDLLQEKIPGTLPTD